MSYPTYFKPLLILLVGYAISSVGCSDNKIDPFEDNAGLFSVYGALSLHESPNYIRVKDLTQEFFSDSARSIGAEVTFEDLQSGSIATLQDTVVKISGEYTHNFILNQNLQPNRSYRLNVEHPSGESVSSIATTPGITQISVSAAENVSCLDFIGVSFKNVKFPEDIRMSVGFEYQGIIRWQIIGRVVQLKLQEENDEKSFRAPTMDLLMEVFPHPRLGDPRVNQHELLPVVLCHELSSDTVYVDYFHFGPEWIDYEEEFTTDPLNSIDVQGGLGFLGAFRRDTFTYTIDRSSTLHLE
jgi:hypothetical protein